MESLIATVVIAVIVIWYLGSTINKLIVKADVIIDGSGEMATDEFASFRKDQKIRLHKTRVKQSKTLDSMADETCYSDQEFTDIFNVMSPSEPEEEKGK